MKLLSTFLLSLTLLMSGPTFAVSAVAKDGIGTTVTIDSDAVCTDKKALKQLPRLNAMLKKANMPEVKADELLKAFVVYEGKTFNACWTLIGMQVVILDDAGQENSIFSVPIGEFGVPAAL